MNYILFIQFYVLFLIAIIGYKKEVLEMVLFRKYTTLFLISASFFVFEFFYGRVGIAVYLIITVPFVFEIIDLQRRVIFQIYTNFHHIAKDLDDYGLVVTVEGVEMHKWFPSLLGGPSRAR